MSLDAIRAAIRIKLEGVSGIGRVYDYERFAKDASAFLALYKDPADGRIRGWWFDRFSTRELDRDTGTVRRVHSWRITGYLGLDDADATGRALQDLVEAIADAFRSDRTLGGTVLDIRDMTQDDAPAGVQVDSIDAVMLAGALCHRAGLRLTTETEETL
ncbi:hypothetical protein [Microcystis phage Mae-JY22]